MPLPKDELETVPLTGAPDKYKVMEFASRIAVEALPDKKALENRRMTLERGISSHLQGDNPDYTTAIHELHELRDAKSGIAWKQEGNILVRDARLQDGAPIDGPEAYQIMTLNYARAATVLLEEAVKRKEITPEQQQESLKAIQQHTRETFRELSISSKPKDDFEHRNTALLDYLAEGLGVNHKTASKQLNLAKDFVGFEDKHVNSITLSSITHDNKRYTVCEAETMLTGMTNNQQEEFRDRENKAWYKEQDVFVKSLIDRYVPQITDDAHTIPTQLRGIPGIRNAYTKTTALAEEGKPLKVVHEGHHSGTVASQAKGGSEEQQRLANQNVEQLATIIGSPIHMVTLNSPNNPTGNDKSIVEQTGKATEAGEGTHTNLAFNFFRRFVGANKTDGVTQLLTETANYAKDEGSPAIADYISGKSKNIKAAQAELSKCEGSSKRMFAAAIEAKETMSKNSGMMSLFDGGNRNLAIASDLAIIRHEMRNEVHNERFAKLPEEVSACQSGKDRNGLKLFNTSLEAVSRALEEQTGVATDKGAIRNRMANAGHTQNQAGNQGGTPGCFGIKGDTKGAIPEEWEKGTKDTLVQKTASFNGKVKEHKPSFIEKLKSGMQKISVQLFGKGTREQQEYTVVPPQEMASLDALKERNLGEIDVSIGSEFVYEGKERRSDHDLRNLVGERRVLTPEERQEIRTMQDSTKERGEELASQEMQENKSLGPRENVMMSKEKALEKQASLLK